VSCSDPESVSETGDGVIDGYRVFTDASKLSDFEVIAGVPTFKACSKYLAPNGIGQDLGPLGTGGGIPGECGYIADHEFYALSIGNFGSSCTVFDDNPTSSWSGTGFVLGKALQLQDSNGNWRRQRCLMHDSFIPYSITFNKWYRAKFERLGQNQWQYTIWEQQANGTFTQIATYTTNSAAGKNGEKMRTLMGGDLPSSSRRLGFYGYWLHPRHHVDFDRAIADW
jgi:hypothetical protein